MYNQDGSSEQTSEQYANTYVSPPSEYYGQQYMTYDDGSAYNHYQSYNPYNNNGQVFYPQQNVTYYNSAQNYDDCSNPNGQQYRGGKRNRGRGGGYRGGYNAYAPNYQYAYHGYSNSEYVQDTGMPADVSQVTEREQKGNRSKHRSYQDNRYRDNRSERRKKTPVTESTTDWRATGSEDLAVPLNEEHSSKRDENFSSVAQASEEVNLPAAKASYNSVRGKRKPQTQGRFKGSAKGGQTSDLAVNKVNVSSKSEPLGNSGVKNNKESERLRHSNNYKCDKRQEMNDCALGDRDETRDCEDRSGTRYKEGLRNERSRGRGRGGRGRFVKGKRKDDQDQRGKFPAIFI